MNKLITAAVYIAAVWISVLSVDADTLRAHWHFDDGTGIEISDDSGSGNIGVARNVKWVRGAKNAGLAFSGNSWVNVGNDPSLCPADEITIGAWIKYWNPDYDTKPAILNKDGSYALYFSPGNTVSVSFWIEGEEITLSSTNTHWPNSRWQHVAATYDGEMIRLYVNGRLDNEMASGGRLDKSKSFGFIGSVNGKAAYHGAIDEVMVSGKALTPEEVHQSYDQVFYEVEREETRFSSYFKKDEKREPKAVIPGFLWIDAEDFDDYGGWWMDSQFVPQMGSPYLLAAGIGTPVQDAKTTFRVSEPGTYRLWVRNRNWLTSHSPGTFRLSIGGKESETLFGNVDSDEWIWQDGGAFELTDAETEIILKDQSGFYGRMDALILTRDTEYVPPQELQAYIKERDRLTGADTNAIFKGDYDVIVVGAGVAGINAAISSSRTGAKTALIHDRPMLGGNNSLELGVVVSGPANQAKPNARESGLNEEVGRMRSYNYHGKWSQAGEQVAAAETNLTVFLNTHVNKTEMDGGSIQAVQAFNMITGERTRYTADVFIDCTGDGWLGYYAGAEYMLGRESRDTFSESNAPEKADNITMSGCLMSGHTLCYNTKKVDSPQPYTGPEWLWDLTVNTEGLQARDGYAGSHTYGRWWHENRGTMDDLWNPELARDELIILNLSYWNWIKNHSNLKEDAANYVITIIPIGNAKRETRRLVGDHILTQDEVINAEPFPDRVAAGGWSLDIHHPEGIFSKEGPFDFNTHVPMNNIPFRALYSKNIDNLLFAGRNVSVSHVALGTVRVQGTTGVMGQAVGTAAALCVKHDANPRGIYESHITELQQKLLKDDQYIIGMKNADPADLARSAKVSASSVMQGSSFDKADVIPLDKAHGMNADRAMMFRRGNTPEVKQVSLLLRSTLPEDKQITLGIRGAKAMNDFSANENKKTATAVVPANSEGWVPFDLNAYMIDTYLWMVLPETEGISWMMMKSGPAGSCRGWKHQGDKAWTPVHGEFYAMHLDTPIVQPGGCEPDQAVNGVTRIVGDQMNMWVSDPQQPLPQHLQLDFGKKQAFNSVYLTFDTNLNEARHCSWEHKDVERMVPESVRDYEVQVSDGSEWKTIVQVSRNYQRRRIHRFPEANASKLRVVVNKTNGDKSARIFEVRVYNE